MTEAQTLVMAYADPPYPGQSEKHYANHPDYAGEVDHVELIARLHADYPDGWALSTSTPALRELLPLCPHDVRVCAWVKPFAVFKQNVRVAHAWEPVIVKPAPRLPGATPTRDYCAANIVIDRGLTGTKPRDFLWWLFGVMGLRHGDRLDDLFPGSGAVSREWEAWQRQLRVDELSHGGDMCPLCGGKIRGGRCRECNTPLFDAVEEVDA